MNIFFTPVLFSFFRTSAVLRQVAQGAEFPEDPAIEHWFEMMRTNLWEPDWFVSIRLHQNLHHTRIGDISPERRNESMIILLIVLILLFGFGGYRMGPGIGYYGGGSLSLILTIVLILLLLKVI
jgi:hypothetical protein